jgi:Holliday junction resolvase RusA-like endonuclease
MGSEAGGREFGVVPAGGAGMRTIVLPGERASSLQKFYAGQHWTLRVEEVNRVRLAVRLALAGDEEPYTVPVDVHITGYFAHHPLDSDNIAKKLYIDALKGWLIQDDDMGWVRWAASRSCIDKTNPRVEITLTEVNHD